MHALIDKKTGQELKHGDIVTDFHGEQWTLCGFTPPRQTASSGRVLLQSRDGNNNTTDYSPAVIGATIVRVPSDLEHAFGINQTHDEKPPWEN